MSLLSVANLRAHFHMRDGVVQAVNGVSFSCDAGETLGIVGESGCGKSVTVLSLLGLLASPPARVRADLATFDGVDLLGVGPAALRAIRGKQVGLVFQDPMTSLNPYMTIGDQVAEPLRVHENMSRRETRQRAVAALEAVGIRDAQDHLKTYPHQFSGGMRQRVTIAMALIAGPKLLIADEPTTALDVTVQAQILDLIKRAQERTCMAMVLITHDLGVIAGTCDRVLVMYAGRIVESAEVRELYARPRHPYTEALMAALPSAHAPNDELCAVPGLPPDLGKSITGCAFAPRCAYAVDACRRGTPQLETVGPGHASACIRVQAGEL